MLSMRVFSKLFAASFIVFFFCSMVFSSPLHVIIDPGHGGSDSGAVQGKAREAEIALKVGRELKNFLEKDSDFSVSMTRDTDHNLSLQERVQIAQKNKADLFLSIHANSSPDKRAHGIELYFQNHLPADEETLYLAANENQLLKTAEAHTDNASDPTKKNDVISIIEDLKRQDRMSSSLKLSRSLLHSWNSSQRSETNVIRQAPFFVVSRVQIPSVLIELGFITHPKESEKLITPSYQREVAQKIYEGLRQYRLQNKVMPLSSIE